MHRDRLLAVSPSTIMASAGGVGRLKVQIKVKVSDETTHRVMMVSNDLPWRVVDARSSRKFKGETSKFKKEQPSQGSAWGSPSGCLETCRGFREGADHYRLPVVPALSLRIHFRPQLEAARWARQTLCLTRQQRWNLLTFSTSQPTTALGHRLHVCPRSASLAMGTNAVPCNTQRDTLPSHSVNNEQGKAGRAPGSGRSLLPRQGILWPSAGTSTQLPQLRLAAARLTAKGGRSAGFSCGNSRRAGRP